MRKKMILNRVRLLSAMVGTLLLLLSVSLSPVNGQQEVNTQMDPSSSVNNRNPERTVTELGIKGTQFTINGTPTFLYGISYYGGLGASEEFILKDLALIHISEPTRRTPI